MVCGGKKEMGVANPVQTPKRGAARPRAPKLISALFLAGFVLVACLVVVGPRSDISHPIHVDEWTHLAYAEALVEEGGTPHAEPLYGLDEVSFRPELGFRVALAELHLATGVDWEDMFPALCAALFVVFAVTMLYLGRVLGAGLLVGVVALGTPTTLRFLGPALVVPVALALTFLVALPLVMLQSSMRERWRVAILVGVILLATLLVHPPTALLAAALTAGIAGYLATRRTGRRKGPLRACVALGLLVPPIWFLSLSGSLRSELLSEAVRSAETGQGLVSDFVYYAGYFRLALFAIAVFAIIFWKIWGKPEVPYVAVLAAYGVLLGFIGLHGAGVLPAANLYDRSWLYLDVTMSVVAGLGLAVLAGRLSVGRHAACYAFRKARPALVLLVAGLIVANAWYTRAQEPMYDLASETSIEDFRWIRANLAQTPGLTLLDPYVAAAYPAVAGRPVYASACEPKPSEDERLQRAIDLLRAPSPDVAALGREDIGIVYEPVWQSAEGVQEVYPGVFVVSGRND